MLCGMLAATGIAGQPQSFFHRPDQRDWARGLGLRQDAPLGDVLSAVRATATNGLCGIRLQQHSHAYLMQTLADYGDTDPDRIEHAFGPTTYIWLRREDKLAQAISVLRAQQTGLWHRGADGSDLERLTPIQPDGYSIDSIAAQIKAFKQADRAWLHWFCDHRIAPCPVTYEALCETLEPTMFRLLINLNLPLEQVDRAIADTIPVPTKKLADAISDTWSGRYRHEVLAKRGESP